MYKKRGIFVLCCLAAVLVVGCGQKENKNTEEQIRTDNKQDTTTDYKDNLKEDETQKAEKTEIQKTITVYSVNLDSGEIQSEEIKVNQLSGEEIWTALKERDVLTTDCKLNTCNVNTEEKKMLKDKIASLRDLIIKNQLDLDVDGTFGNYIRTMGTTEEQEVLKCIVNTFLDSYSCEKIKITENGQPLETSSAVLNGYMTKQ